LGEEIAVLRGQGKALASATETAEIERHGILRHCSPLNAFYAPLSYTPPDLISYRDIAAALS
jgi:hypothetical protein